MSLLILGDAHDTLELMPSESVDTVITSPPYFWQRDYEVVGQIGREETIQEYLERLWAVFDVVKGKLKPEGTLFLNLGDKYVGKDRMMIPEDFAKGMKRRGWILRNEIIWHKKNPKPESTRSRFPNDWESIFFFVKSEDHYFAPQYEPYARSSIERCKRFVENGEAFDPQRHKHDPANVRQAAMNITKRIATGMAKNLCIPGQTPNGMHAARAAGEGRDIYDSRGRRMRSVWSVAVGRYRKGHFATWPPELARRMILAGCPVGGTALDPFVGSGTTLIVAEELGCAGIGIDLNPEYLELAKENILEARKWRAVAQTKRSTPRPRRTRQDNRRNRHLPAEAGQSLTPHHIPEVFEDI